MFSRYNEGFRQVEPLCTSMCFSLICGVRQGGVLSPVLFAVYTDDLIVKLTKANLGCCIGNVSFCCLFYADDIVLLSGSLYKLQLMLNICDVEIRTLDLKFNPLKCHVLRVGKNYDSEYKNVFFDNCAIALRIRLLT